MFLAVVVFARFASLRMNRMLVLPSNVVLTPFRPLMLGCAQGFKTLRARSDVVRQIGFFLGHSATRRESFVERLLQLRGELCRSEWFQHSEVGGE